VAVRIGAQPFPEDPRIFGIANSEPGAEFHKTPTKAVY
jgi:hypothetical protein